MQTFYVSFFTPAWALIVSFVANNKIDIENIRMRKWVLPFLAAAVIFNLVYFPFHCNHVSLAIGFIAYFLSLVFLFDDGWFHRILSFGNSPEKDVESSSDRGSEHEKNEVYTSQIKEAIANRNILPVRYDGIKAIKTDVFYHEAIDDIKAYEIPLRELNYKDKDLSILNRAIEILSKEDRDLLKDVQILFYEGETEAHYGLLRDQIYINIRYIDDYLELMRLIHHEVQERAYVVKNMDKQASQWRNDRTAGIERRIDAFALQKHESLILDENDWLKEYSSDEVLVSHVTSETSAEIILKYGFYGEIQSLGGYLCKELPSSKDAESYKNWDYYVKSKDSTKDLVVIAFRIPEESVDVCLPKVSSLKENLKTNQLPKGLLESLNENNIQFGVVSADSPPMSGYVENVVRR